MFVTLFQLMGMMFLLILVGTALRALKIITDEGKKCLTDIIIYAILPCNIIKAFCTDLGDHILKRFSVLILVAAASQILALFTAKMMYRKMNKRDIPIYQYATVCSNSGFIGNPLAEGIFGSTGLIYASVFLLPQRVVMWTAGVSFFSKTDNKKNAYKKVLTHPCMLATYIGFAIMLLPIQLPSVLSKAIASISGCCTPMTMMYMGVILADVNVKELIDRQQLYYCFLRLIALPLILYLGCMALKIDPLITGVSVLLMGMPAGSTTSLLAAKYGADERTATKCVVLSTLLSIITIPLWSMILLSGIS